MKYGLEERIYYSFMMLKRLLENFSEENIGYVSKISDLYADSNYVWISSSSGLSCLDRLKKEKVNFGVEEYIFSG